MVKMFSGDFREKRRNQQSVVVKRINQQSVVVKRRNQQSVVKRRNGKIVLLDVYCIFNV